ncbi:MAG: sulfotransferase family 2 domain-containing protein [Luteolibacter sp.]
MISLARKFIFVHVPKTAGNSLQGILKNYSEDRIVVRNDQDGIERFEIESPMVPITKHSNLAFYYEKMDRGVFAEMYKFGCVRNPWDRMISYYFSPNRKNTEFVRKDFMRLLRKTPAAISYLTLDGTTDGDIGVDFILRFESLSADFSKVCDRIGIESPVLPHRNASIRNHYSVYYDQQMIDLVAARFAREIAMFGYDFDVSG